MFVIFFVVFAIVLVVDQTAQINQERPQFMSSDTSNAIDNLLKENQIDAYTRDPRRDPRRLIDGPTTWTGDARFANSIEDVSLCSLPILPIGGSIGTPGSYLNVLVVAHYAINSTQGARDARENVVFDTHNLGTMVSKYKAKRASIV